MNQATAIDLEDFSRACVLDAASLQMLIAEFGLSLTIRDAIDHFVAQWPTPTEVTGAGTSYRKAVVFRRNDQGGWRGALLVSFEPKSWDLVDFVSSFRDLLHVGIWLRGHAPKTAQPGPARLV